MLGVSRSGMSRGSSAVGYGFCAIFEACCEISSVVA